MQRTVLITGAGSGIGLASALEAARLGFRVVAAVHREEDVEDVRRAAADAGVRQDVTTEVLDVTDADGARRLVERAAPWALVNNAAVINAGALVDVPLEEARQLFDIVVFAPVHLARLALPGMRRAGGGRIVNVSSIGQETIVPLLGWYDAAKAALSALSDALRQEVAHHGVEVVLVEPGVIDTPIWERTAEDLRRRQPTALEPHVYDRGLAAIDRVTGRASAVEEVARTVGAALHAGHPRFRYRVGAGSHALPQAVRVIPTGVRDRVTRAVAGM